MIKKAFTVLWVTTFSLASVLLAKPMSSPDPVDMALKADSIVVADFVDYKDPKGKTNEDIYMRGVLAKFKVLEVLKGETLSGDIEVSYSFNNFSWCLPDSTFRFDTNLMPQSGSKWILFLKRSDTDYGWGTCRGDAGRYEYNPENLLKVQQFIKESLEKKSQ
jgi:hypothetical protein